MQELQRHTYKVSGVTAATSAANSTPIPKHNAAGGGFVLTSGSLATATFYVSADNVTYYALHDAANSAISRPLTADKAQPLPEELFGWPWFKIVGDAAGVITVSFQS